MNCRSSCGESKFFGGDSEEEGRSEGTFLFALERASCLVNRHQ